MSIKRMSEVWDVKFPTLAQKIVTLRIADYSSDEGHSIFPSNEALARAAQCDERTVQRVTKALRSCGLLHLIREGGQGPKSTNHWWLNVSLLKALADGKCQIVGSATELEIDGEQPVEEKGDSVSPLEPGRVTNDPLRVTPVSSKGDTSVTQSINNHQIDPSTRERARESEFSRSVRALETTPSDPQWDAWMDHFTTTGRDDLAEAARRLGKVVADARWPTNAARVLEPKAGDYTKRMTGEAV